MWTIFSTIALSWFLHQDCGFTTDFANWRLPYSFGHSFNLVCIQNVNLLHTSTALGLLLECLRNLRTRNFANFRIYSRNFAIITKTSRHLLNFAKGLQYFAELSYCEISQPPYRIVVLALYFREKNSRIFQAKYMEGPAATILNNGYIAHLHKFYHLSIQSLANVQ
jgi:hypothetical protein